MPLNSEVLQWKYRNFLINKNSNFNKNEILKILSSDDIDEARTTKMRVLKSRYTGDVGLASHLLYDKHTGRLSEVDISDINVDDRDQGF